MIDNDLKGATKPACLAGRAGSVLPMAERVFITVRLRLALDEVETGPGDLKSMQNAIQYQIEALRAAQRRLDRMACSS
ncbi:hypothetical protein [Paracoccus sp. KR1-242]|uniref:hypothetical protein n=1 Tax=Paracoccus sp. KR1-242 TaxID=3410028 RepID=UPI003BFC9036